MIENAFAFQQETKETEREVTEDKLCLSNE